MNQKNWFIILTAILTTILLSSVLTTYTPQPTIKSAEAQYLGGSRAERNWEYVDKDVRASNYNPQTQINKDNVHLLELKWMFPLPENAGYSVKQVGRGLLTGADAPPLIVDGIVYLADNMNNIHAIDLTTGKAIWVNEYEVNIPELAAKLPLKAGLASPHLHAINYANGWILASGSGCTTRAVSALSGETAWTIHDRCKDVEGNQYDIKGQEHQPDYKGPGLYSPTLVDNPPSFYTAGNMLVQIMSGGDGITGGRTFVDGYDVSSTPPRHAWRTFISPPAEGDRDWALRNCDIGWFFSEKAFTDEGRLGLPCSEVRDECRECLVNDWGVPTHWGATVSATWGQIVIDEETGIAYFGTGNPTPVVNQTWVTRGPNLYSASVVAVDSRTGEMLWWFQMHPHGTTSNDCAWSTMLFEATIDGQKRKVIKKGCKAGAVMAILDAATGEPLRMVRNPHHIAMGAPSPHSAAKDPRNLAQMTMPWCGYGGLTGPEVKPGDYCYMSPEMAYYTDNAWDGETLYFISNAMANHRAPIPFQDHYGRSMAGQFPGPGTTMNHTVYAWDLDTGKPKWSYFIDTTIGRGALIVSGGVVYWASGTGYLYGWDAETGELLLERYHGQNVKYPVIGMDAEGRTRLFVIVGGKATLASRSIGWSTVPGALLAYGLPDKMPEPEIVEVERVVPGPERVVEVEVERIVEVEKVVEVPVEVVRDVEVISPISYIVIGVGVILVVVAGILFTRKRNI